MALVKQDRSEDLSLIGLIFAVIAIVAAAIPCVKTAVDQFFSLIF
jgi:hypothetical protein